MKLSLAITMAAAALVNFSPYAASSAEPENPPTPTTRILAIGTVNPGVDLTAVRSILPDEVRETVKLYLDGKIVATKDRSAVLTLRSKRRRVHPERNRPGCRARHAYREAAASGGRT